MKRALLAALVVVATIVPGCATNTSAPPVEKMTVYVGSYADVKADGIHQFTLDMGTGELTKAGGTSVRRQPVLRGDLPRPQAPLCDRRSRLLQRQEGRRRQLLLHRREDGRPQADQPADVRRRRPLFHHRRPRGQVRPRRQLRRRQRRVDSRVRRQARRARNLHPAPGLQRQQGPPERAPRAFDQRLAGQPVRVRRRPGPRQDPGLQARRGEGHDDAQRSAVRGDPARLPGRVTSRSTRAASSPTSAAR